MESNDSKRLFKKSIYLFFSKFELKNTMNYFKNYLKGYFLSPGHKAILKYSTYNSLYTASGISKCCAHRVMPCSSDVTLLSIPV